MTKLDYVFQAFDTFTSVIPRDLFQADICLRVGLGQGNSSAIPPPLLYRKLMLDLLSHPRSIKQN